MVPKNAKFSGGNLDHPTRGVFRPRRIFSKIRLAPYGNRVYNARMDKLIQLLAVIGLFLCNICMGLLIYMIFTLI